MGEEQRDVQYLDVDLSSVRLLAEQVPEQRWSAAIEMQSVFRTMSQSLRWKDELLASDVLTRVIRRFLVRHRLKMQFEEVRKEAIQISRTQMLECEKVLCCDYLFDGAANVAVEKWRLVKAMVAHKSTVRALFLHYSSQGLTDATNA